MRAQPGERIRAERITVDGCEVIRFRTEELPIRFQWLRMAAAKRLETASKDSARFAAALAEVLPSDTFLDSSRLLEQRTVWRVRSGNLRCLGTMHTREAFTLFGLLNEYDHRLQWASRIPSPATMQRPATRWEGKRYGRGGRRPLELRLAPGSRVRIPCGSVANDVGAK